MTEKPPFELTTSRLKWWFAEPEQKNRAQAIGLRLAIAYHEKDLATVESLLPEDEDELRLVMGSLENGLLMLNQFDPPGHPEVVWQRVTPIIDASSPRGIAVKSRALLALMSDALYTATLGDAYEVKEADPYTAAHLFGALTAMRSADHEGSIGRMREKADELYPLG
jgi:hypothetical protein